MSKETPTPGMSGSGNAAAQMPVPVPNEKFTIAQSRLTGSADCLNCGTGLMGPFCHYCGQPDKNLMRFFPALLREMMSDFLDFDSRFVRTLKPLLFHPGRLTRDYLDGKRFRYVPPLRLYIFSSIAFFFLAAIVASDSINVNTDADADPDVATQMDDEAREQLQEALSGLEQTRPELAAEIAEKVEAAQAESGEAAEEEFGKPDFDVNGKPWDEETNPLVIPLMPDWVNDRINREIAESPQKGKEISENPDLIRDQFFEVLPATMFVLLPLVALLFKFWYLFANRYYVEHLIFALHNHSFIFVAALLMVVVNGLAAWIDPSVEGLPNKISELVNFVLVVWVPIYLLVSLRRVYGQGWGMTLAKYATIGISYLALLTAATAFAGALSFVLL